MDLVGKKFGKLTVLSLSYVGKNYAKHYLCLCECGNKKIIYSSNLTGGKTRSCGCLYKEAGQKLRKYNKYYYENDFMVGITSNTGNKFYFDKEDFNKIKELCWFETKQGYLQNKSGNKIIHFHRLVTNCPSGMDVDHINHNPLDNRKENLRICTHKENMQNYLIKRPNILSEYGISKHKTGNNEYFMIQLKGKYWGNYKHLKEAIKERDKILNKLNLKKQY